MKSVMSFSVYVYRAATGLLAGSINLNFTPDANKGNILAGTSTGRNPLVWTLEGSDNATDWVLLDHQALTHAEIAAWNSAGSSGTNGAAPGPNQARSFPQTANPILTVKAGATLGGAGSVAHTLALADGATLLKTGAPADGLTVAGDITLPESGAVTIALPIEAHTLAKQVILKGQAVKGLKTDRFTVPEGYLADTDATCLFIRKRAGILVAIR